MALRGFKKGTVSKLWDNRASDSSQQLAVQTRMEVTRRLGMRDTVLALLLAFLQGFPLGESAPNPSPLVGSNWGNPRRYIHLQTSTDLKTVYLEMKLDGAVGRTTTRTSYSKTRMCLVTKRIDCQVLNELLFPCLPFRCAAAEI